MRLGIQTIICHRCGKTFTHILGGIVFNPTPLCPLCQSLSTITVSYTTLRTHETEADIVSPREG